MCFTAVNIEINLKSVQQRHLVDIFACLNLNLHHHYHDIVSREVFASLFEGCSYN